jgi:hypothetical protein
LEKERNNSGVARSVTVGKAFAGERPRCPASVPLARRASHLLKKRSGNDPGGHGGKHMRKQVKKLALSRETIRQLEKGQVSGGVVGDELVEDTNDRRCEPSIVSCHAGC